MKYLYIALAVCVPGAVAHAQATVGSILDMVLEVIKDLIPLSVGIALMVFLWGIIRMLVGMNAGDADAAITDGKKRMIWGVVALFVIVSIWGIVSILVTMFGVSIGGYYPPPQV